MAMGMPYGMQAMLKDGHKMMSGLEEAVMKNIDACKSLADITRTSMGPNGMNKMVINHLEKHFVTSDASTIVAELEVQHPAANVVVAAARAQAQEIGDGTNFVLTFAGELLAGAEPLLREGLLPTEVADGYAGAAAHALEALEGMALEDSSADLRDSAQASRRLLGPLASKQYGQEATLAALVADACIRAAPPKGSSADFNVDNVRVLKVPGAALSDSSVVSGLALRRDVEGTVRLAEGARVAVFAQALDTAATETKGTVLLRSGAELEAYARGEEAKVEALVEAIAAAGATVVVSGGAFGELALHFLERKGLMAIRVPSKFDLRRVCRATGAVAQARVEAPAAADLGRCSRVQAREVGGAQLVVFEAEAAKVCTIVLRSATSQALDDLERAVDDGVNAYRALTRDARVLPAGGAAEVALSRRLRAWAKNQTGAAQHAAEAFAAALLVVPRTLAENSGLRADQVLADLQAAHVRGEGRAGVDVEGEAPVKDLSAEGIVDLFAAKWWGLRLAADAAVTVLRVDQIIMAKAAGGPRPRQGGDPDDD